MTNTLNFTTFTSLNPLDGRYAKQLADIAPIFSELHLTLLRLTVEIEWLKTVAKEPKLKELKTLDKSSLTYLHNIIANFELKDLMHIKELETKTNHDLKAIEYFLKEKLAAHQTLKNYQEFVHFGCTSDDINNLSYAITLSKSRDEFLLPAMKNIILHLEKMAHEYAKTPMLSHTHGQPATPTTFGKEMANFAYRLTRQFDYLFITPILGKFNGAIGCYNALTAAYPEIDWQKISQKFVEQFNLTWNPYTTQIEPHDWIAEYSDILARFNTILLGLCRDTWHYIAIGYLKQKSQPGEIGSSTMPHKINPIDFENAEGNLGLANALLRHFSNKLPISRWQRDLSDSTVMRNLGSGISYSLLAYRSIEKGLNKLAVDHQALKTDLNRHWEVLAEPLQTVMRRFGINNPYEQLKTLTRGKAVNKKVLHKFIRNSGLPHMAKQRLLKLTPENYLGEAKRLAETINSFRN